MREEIRRIKPDDYDFILGLNQDNIEVLSPMSREKLAFLDAAAELSVVVDIDDSSAAFLFALRRGVNDYDLACYRWFSDRYPSFLYIDSIVIDKRYRHMGVGKRLYEMVFEHAKKIGAEFVAAGITTKPYNEKSLMFHRANGFAEVGELAVRDGAVRVSQQIAEVGRRNERDAL